MPIESHHDDGDKDDLISTLADGFERISLAITLWTKSQIDLQRLHAIRVQSDALVNAMSSLVELASTPVGSQTKTKQQKENSMATPQDDFTQLETNNTALVAGIAAVNTAIQALDAQILAFQNSPGTLSAADQARLDAITTTSNSLATSMAALVAAAQAPVVVTPPPPVVTPPPTP